MSNIGDVNFDKKNIIIAVIILIVIGVACWGMFSGGIPADGGAINQVRAELESARAELDVANRKLAESQSIADDLRRTIADSRAEVEGLRRENSEIRELISSVRSTNNQLAEQINRGSDLNNENLKLVRESQQGLRTVREAGQRGNP